MIFCPKCGAQHKDGTQFCTTCGYALAQKPQSASSAGGEFPFPAPGSSNQKTQSNAGSYQQTYTPPPNPRPHVLTKEDLPKRFRPLSAWAYFGYSILFSIPLIGFILLIVFACGGGENVNLRSYARSYFCWLAILLIIVIILLIAGVSFSALDAYNYLI